MSDVRRCELFDRVCMDCGECDVCDLDEQKTCDNCMRCIKSGADYAAIEIDEVIMAEADPEAD